MEVLLLLLACVGMVVGMGVDYRRECGGEGGPALTCSSYREGGEVRCGGGAGCGSVPGDVLPGGAAAAGHGRVDQGEALTGCT